MEALSHFFKRSVPTFFESLPIPDSFSGLADLNAVEWVELAVFAGSLTVVGYSIYNLAVTNFNKKECSHACKLNPSIKKDVDKVVDFVDIEDITQEKISYCRCWRSKKFPYCDGSHNAYNQENQDNVGPVVVRHKPSSK